jgi:hypothetical protein
MDDKKSFRLKGTGYAIFHSSVHVTLAFLLYVLSVRSISLDIAKLVAIGIGSAIMDLDHVALWRKIGIVGYIKLRSEDEIGKARRYAFHSLSLVLLLVAGSLILLVGELRAYQPIGLFFAAAAMHGLWDFFEDVAIFKVGYRHWL